MAAAARLEAHLISCCSTAERQKRTMSLVSAVDILQEDLRDHSRARLPNVDSIAAALVDLKHLTAEDVFDQISAHNGQ